MVLAAVATGCSGGEATTTEPTSPTTTVGSTASSSASGYDLGGRDVTAICAQLKVFADEWEDFLPAGASEQEKREIARQGVVRMVAAADKLTTLAPPGLAA